MENLCLLNYEDTKLLKRIQTEGDFRTTHMPEITQPDRFAQKKEVGHRWRPTLRLTKNYFAAFFLS